MDRTVILEDMNSTQAMSLIGTDDRNLEVLSECFGKEIVFRDNTFTIKDCSESEAKQIQEVLMALYEVARKNQPVSEQDVIYACRLVARNENIRFDELSGMVIGRTLTGG